MVKLIKVFKFILNLKTLVSFTIVKILNLKTLVSPTIAKILNLKTLVSSTIVKILNLKTLMSFTIVKILNWKLCLLTMSPVSKNCQIPNSSNAILLFLKYQSEILATQIDESWTHHFLHKITKDALVGLKWLMTFWLGLVKILSYKDFCLCKQIFKTSPVPG
jgi:hypothetical protein